MTKTHKLGGVMAGMAFSKLYGADATLTCKKIFEKYSSVYKIKRIQMKEKDMNEVLKKEMMN